MFEWQRAEVEKRHKDVDPSDQLIALARHRRSGSASNVVGVHLYTFGGVARSARWMNEQITTRAT